MLESKMTMSLFMGHDRTLDGLVIMKIFESHAILQCHLNSSEVNTCGRFWILKDRTAFKK